MSIRRWRAAALAASAVAVVVVVGGARAGFTPAWSYLPAKLRVTLAAKEGGTLYLPARVPLFYRYRSGAAVANGKLSVPFTNRVRIRAGVWKWTKQSFLWEVLPLGKGTACTSWKTIAKTYQVDGNKVYWVDEASGGSAWRCVVDRGGKSHVLVATKGGNLGGVGLAIVAASGLDVSGRISAVNVSLAVTPSSVRRGKTVLVHGVAGGCAAGDTVLVLSRAFSAVNSFAGVPAASAEVGAAGRFSAVARIPATRSPGTYVVTARCGGGNLGVSAHLTVTR